MGLERNRTLLAKEEDSYGSDPSPSATDAVRISNLVVTPEVKVLTRDNYKGSMSSDGIRVGGKTYRITFDIELKGRDAIPSAANPLEYDALLRACAMTVDYSATYATYTPESDDTVGVTMYANYDGVRYELNGCQGNFTISAVAGEVVKLSFDFLGLYNIPAAQDMPTPSFDSSELPPIFESASFSVDSFEGIINELTMDMGNTISPRPDANSADGIKGYRISGREVSGTIDPEEDLSSKNLFTKFASSDTSVMEAYVGATAGNRFHLYWPTVQYRQVAPDAREGINIHSVEYIATGDDNEFRLRCY